MRPSLDITNPVNAWISAAPEGWRVHRIRDVAELTNGYPFPSNRFSRDDGVRIVRIRDLTNDDDRVFTDVPAPANVWIRNGDVLIGMDGDFTVHTWRRGVAVLNQRLCCLRAGPGLDPRFLAYVLPFPLKIINDLTYFTTVKHLSSRQVLDIRFVAPPSDEQAAIADYLDEKTAAIDGLIAKRERHIELLEEQRQAVLVDRVTRGLYREAPMRESGVNWLGAIPAHWIVAPTRFVARLETGHTPSRQHPEYWVPEECTVPWFTLADVWQIREGRQEYLGDTAEQVSPLGLANSAARLLPAGTVVLSRTASVGFSGIMPVPMATSQDFVNWVCGPEIRPLYLLYVFRAMRQEFRRLTMGSTHQTIYMPDVRDFRTPLPPLEEQDAIVAAVRAELARHDGLVARLRQQIEKLREYRQTLISAAVTGQIPVREEVPA